MKRILLAVVVCIYLHNLPASTSPEQLNNQDTSKSEKTSQVSPQIKKKKVVHDRTVTPLVTRATPACDAYDALIAKHFGVNNLNIAKAVMRAESGCRADAVGDGDITYIENGTTYGMSCGLFQIRSFPERPSCEAMKDARKNIEYAASMFATQGWTPWSAYLNGSYRQFIN